MTSSLSVSYTHLDYPLTIGSGQFIEGFEDSVVDHNIGDTYDWEGKFPDNYLSLIHI